MKFRVLLASFSLLLFTCGEPPTPSGTSLLTLDVASQFDPETVASFGEVRERTARAELPLGGALAVRSKTARAQDGGRYVTEIEVLVEDSAGWTFTGSGKGASPVNVGGPGGAASFEQTVSITQARTEAMGRRSGQVLITVKPDGSIEVH